MLAANGIPFNNSHWISTGGIPGTSGNVFASAVDDSGNLYIGGSFTIVGDVLATNIAKWDGSTWSAVGSGLNAQVNALAVSGSDLYAGGAFTNAGGSNVNRIAKWDGSNWSALGSGLDAQVNALAVSGSDLYVGGAFTNAGGSNVNYIARWDGSTWSALGSGMNYRVHAFAVSGSDVYAGGDFGTAGGNPAVGVAKWNGSSWSALGSGLGHVRALVVTGGDLYAPRRREGRFHPKMERDQLVGAGFGGSIFRIRSRSLYAGGVRQRPVCGR